MAVKIPTSAVLREFAYTVLYTIPPEERFALKGSFYNLTVRKSAAKSFCEKASEEQIKYVLSMLGFEWFTVIYDNKKTPRWARNVFNKFDEKEEKHSLKNILADRIYITNSKQYAQNLLLASQSINQESTTKILEMGRAGYHVKKWSRYLDGETMTETKTNASSLVYLCRTIFNGLISAEHFEISKDEISILLYLYPHQNKFVEHGVMYEKFESMYSVTKMTSILKKLLSANLIQKHPMTTKRKYMITASGILKTGKFIQQVLTANNF